MYFVWFSLWHDGNWCSFSSLVFLHHIVICLLRSMNEQLRLRQIVKPNILCFQELRLFIVYNTSDSRLRSIAAPRRYDIGDSWTALNKEDVQFLCFFLKAVAHKMKKKISDRIRCIFFLHTTLYMKKDRIISGNFVPTFIRLLNEIKWNKWIVKW